MNKQKIIDLLMGYSLKENINKPIIYYYRREQVEQFASYIIKLENEKDSSGRLKNTWLANRTEEEMAELFRRVAEDGLVFDGKHITLQPTGISYDYVAYKNKMLLAYPESQIDVSLVYEGDDFQVAKESGSVIYHHNIKEPFNRKEENIIGGYCVIKNKRGEFLTLLSREEIEKHRKTAKTDYIWRQWFMEMALKTIIKKAVKQHFSDVFEKIEDNDNENYSLDNPLDLELKTKQEIDEITTLEDLKKYYEKNKGQGSAFNEYIAIRKNQLTQQV